jgi:hypothetical protein
MDFVCTTLQLSFFTSRSAHAVVMKHGELQRRLSKEQPEAFFRHRDSLLCLGIPLSIGQKCDDDDTASTASSCSYLSSENSTFPCSVTFADPLVTCVYLRPTTTIKEKSDLYYSDADFRTFRRDFYFSRQTRPRDSVVSFSETVVTDIHTYACPADKDAMYYSESDLKRFLDEFVSSLNASSISDS